MVSDNWMTPERLNARRAKYMTIGDSLISESLLHRVDYISDNDGVRYSILVNGSEIASRKRLDSLLNYIREFPEMKYYPGAALYRMNIPRIMNTPSRFNIESDDPNENNIPSLFVKAAELIELIFSVSSRVYHVFVS